MFRPGIEPVPPTQQANILLMNHRSPKTKNQQTAKADFETGMLSRVFPNLIQ